jgi:hypothetical protein
MKRILIPLAAIVLLFGSVALAETLQLDQKASDWSFADADGKVHTLDSWAGKVLRIPPTSSFWTNKGSVGQLFEAACPMTR